MTTTHSMPNLGTQQSPIKLENAFEAKSLGVSVEWNALILAVNKKDGHDPTRKLHARASAKSGHLLLDGQRYLPVDLHWHFPAEHTLGGQKKSFAAEVHVVHVHRNDVQYALQGKLDWCRIAVLGVFVEEGRRAYAPMQVAAGESDDKELDEQRLERNAILPRNSSAIRYDGSLTTPPYSENVTFIIYTTPVSATAEQLADQGLANARSLQACNRRYCVMGKVGTKKLAPKKS